LNNEYQLHFLISLITLPQLGLPIPANTAVMRQSIAILSVFASAAMAADVVSFYFPGGKLLTVFDP
jgi:hypothetical protein